MGYGLAALFLADAAFALGKDERGQVQRQKAQVKGEKGSVTAAVGAGDDAGVEDCGDGQLPGVQPMAVQPGFVRHVQHHKAV